MASFAEETSSSISVTDVNTPTVGAPIITGLSTTFIITGLSSTLTITGSPSTPNIAGSSSVPTITGLSSTPTIVGSSVSAMPLVPPFPHHAQQPLCLSRPRYRQGRRLTAIKAYTISDESVYLLITGVPGLKLQRELKNLCHKFGTVRCLNRVDDYPVEPFAEAYLVKYGTVKEARFAKKMLDGKNFFGGVFHVCYAPELESVDETREKLEERRRAVQFALHKQEREKKLLEEGADGGGSVLCQYHPDDKLASAIKRVTNRLSCNKEPVNIGPKGSHWNHKNGLDVDRQFDTSFHKDTASCSSTQSLDNSLYNCSMPHAMAGNCETADATRNQFETASLFQNDLLYAVPPSFHSCAGTASTYSDSSQGPYVSETSSHQTNINLKNYPSANPPSNPYYVERLDPKVDSPTQPSLETSSATASIGQQYASMSTDYEPGLGRTGGERYIAPNKKHKRNGFINKATVKSFTIKPTKAYKNRKVEITCDEKRATDGACKPMLGYRQVVRSLQQQRSGQGDVQLSRLQLALHATLGAPTAQNKVVPAPNRPTPKMKLLTQGVKLV